jgi:co-chaperonin GroES (HSP10)
MTKGTTIKPLRDLLLVELDKVAEVSKSGIYMAQGWEKTQHTCTVLAVGEKVEGIKVGDRLVVNPYALLDCQVDLEEYQFLRQGDILAYV